MKINKIVLKNFKSYTGEVVLDLSVTEEKNVVVIYADNGFGKTSILQAINWVLYNDSYIEELNFGKKQKDNFVTIKNWINENHLVDSIKTGKMGNMSVEMQFEDSNTIYQIYNNIEFKAKTKDDINIVSGHQVLKKLPQGSKGWTTSTNIKLDINRILPESIKNYFFFDAEKQSNLTMPNNQSKIQEAIFKIVGLETLQNAIKDLNEVENEFAKELRNLNLGNYSNKKSEKIELQKMIDDDEESLNKKIHERDKLKQLIDSVESELRNLPDTSAIQKSIDKLREHREQLFKEKEKSEKELSAICYKYIPFLLLNHITDFNEELLKLKKEGKIPGSISLVLIKEILETKLCICGTKINENNSHSKDCNVKINKLYEEVQSQSESKQTLLDIYSKTSGLISLINDQNKEGLKQTIQIIDNYEDSIIQINEEIKELDSEMGDIDNDDIQQKKDKKESWAKDLSDIDQAIGRLSQIIEDNKELLKDLINDLKKMELDDEQAKKIDKYETLARDASESLSQIFKSFADATRSEITSQSNLQWNKLIKSTKKLKIHVDESYSLKVTNNLDQNAINDLAEGQKQGLVLAFVAAISNVSNKYPPYIIDMPFGRLGEDSQKEVAQFLPNVSKQLILLLNQSSEWNEVTKNYLTNKCSKIIELKFDENNRSTTVNKIK